MYELFYSNQRKIITKGYMEKQLKIYKKEMESYWKKHMFISKELLGLSQNDIGKLRKVLGHEMKSNQTNPTV